MKKVKPYKSKSAAMKAIDNGGRFYNLLTKANDGEVTEAELSRVAGVFSDHKLMHLFIEMSLIELPNATDIKNTLSTSLKQSYHEHKPNVISLHDSLTIGCAGQTVIVTGIPLLVESKTEFSGFITIPMTTGNVTTMMMVPIFDQYEVYELKDEISNNNVLLAHTRGGKKLDPVPTRIGGCLKERQQNEDTDEKDLFIEVCYYTPLY